MGFIGVLGGIAAVFLLACLSPGPVWVIITSTSAAVSRRAGVLTGLGVAGATLTWATLASLGLGLLAQLTWLAVVTRLAGAAYLVWVGARMMAGAHRPAPAAAPSGALPNGWTSVRRGYLSSITNPKAAAFFSSIFVVMLPAHAPAWVYAAAVILLASLSATWHCGLALVFSLAPVRDGYRTMKARIDTIAGGILVALGLRLALPR